MQIANFLAGAVPGVLLTVCTAALFLYGGSLVVEGRLSTGSLVAMMAYHARLLAPVQNLMGLYTNLVSGGVSLSRVWELFDTPAAVVEARDAAPIDVVRGEITVEDVAFSHAGMPVLSGLSFRVQPGTICAILGPSGPANRRWPTCWSAFTIRRRARFAWMGAICANFAWPISGVRLCWWINCPTSSMQRCVKIFSTRVRMRTMRR